MLAAHADAAGHAANNDSGDDKSGNGIHADVSDKTRSRGAFPDKSLPDHRAGDGTTAPIAQHSPPRRRHENIASGSHNNGTNSDNIFNKNKNNDRSSSSSINDNRGSFGATTPVPGAEGADRVEQQIEREQRKAATIRAQMSVLMLGFYEIVRQVLSGARIWVKVGVKATAEAEK